MLLFSKKSFQFKRSLKMINRSFPKISNKQNYQSVQQKKQATKTMNFGKLIKCKAHILTHQSPSLKQNRFFKNKFPQNQAFSTPQCSNLKLFKTPSFSEDQFSFKSKMVRFEDEDCDELSQTTLQISRNLKKPPTSILKKTPSVDKMSVNSGNSDMGQVDFLNAKNSLKDKGGNCSNDKYIQQVKMLKYQNVKYFDKLFPPGGASLCFSKQKIEQLKNIRWMRIQDLFKGKKLVIFNQNSYSKCIYNRGPIDYAQNIIIAFNSLSNSNRCLQRIFEQQKVTGLCIYYLRINHDGIWKYIMIDDYIPVVHNGQSDVPAFINVLENQCGEIQIWPLLLHKALAKIYNCYQSLFNDSVVNLLFDLTGFPYEVLNLQDEASEFKFRSSLSHSQTVCIMGDAYNKQMFIDDFYPIREDGGMTSSTYFNLDLRMKLMDLKRYTNILIDLGDLKKQFKTAIIYHINDTYYSLGCIIKQAKNTISMRKFVIKERVANCILNLIQKDKKYYQNNGYDYVWSRIMIVMKDGVNGYRWIDGKYSTQRILSFYLNLEPGQYFVIINGDWKSRAFQMYLNFLGNQEIQFSREIIENHPNILTQICIDVSQRFGSLTQINKNLCSYRLIDTKNGFLIQNINNEVNRPIFFHKSYNLKGTKYELINKEKYLQDQQNSIQIKIDPNGHFTFIAKLIDGFDQQLLQNFNF